jgi:hypothetical protein
MKLEADGVVVELAARQPRTLDGVLAFFDPLFRRAALIVERHNALGGTPQVGDDEADAGIELARIPLHLGDHAAFAVSRSGLIAEAGVGAADMIGRATDWTREQVGDAFLQDRVGRETDGVGVAPGFQELIDFR